MAKQNFKAILGGLTPINVGHALKRLWNYVNEIRDAVNEIQANLGLPQLDSDEPQEETVPVAGSDDGNTVTMSSSSQDEPSTGDDDETDEFEWSKSEDLEEIRAWFFIEHGISSRKQKLETIKAEIQAYLDTLGD
jgi:hypothetical protein